MSYKDIVKKHQANAYALADTALADTVKDCITVVDTDAVESDFSELLTLIQDAELRDMIDTAAGRIAFAYEKLGFVQGILTDHALRWVS